MLKNYSEKSSTKGRKYGNIWDWGGILILACLVLLILLYYFIPSMTATKLLPLLLGVLIVVAGYYHLIYKLPKMAKDVETRLSIEALRVSFWLVIFGLIIIILGLLYLMDVLPLGWRS
jgi:ABC-type multidrug transport system permease subunit